MQIGIRQSLYFFMIDLIEIKKPLALCSGFFGIWRPYGDSNPGYRRERATLQSSIFYHVFCKVMLMWVGILKRGVNFQVLNVSIVALFEYQNDLTVLKHDKAEHLVSLKN